MKRLNKYQIKTFFRYTLWKPLKCFFNIFYFIRYPFLQPRNLWTGKKTYSFTWYSFIPTGWKKAFGKQFTKDLRKALIKDGILKTFYFTDIKEKYGTLRLYNNGEGLETEKVIRYYEFLSMCYCFRCGKLARYETKGWIEYLCEDCFDEIENTDRPNYAKYKLSCRLTRDNIPHYYKYKNKEKIEVDIGIDFKKFWRLDEDETL